jgi:hypothetical protein
MRRPTPPRETPWGRADHITQIIPGIWHVSTPSHGGIWLSPERQAAVPDYMRSADAWYEEDCDWAVPFVVFERDIRSHCTDEYTQYTQKVFATGQHLDTLRNWRPDDYERFFAVHLGPGQSYIRDHPLPPG